MLVKKEEWDFFTNPDSPDFVKKFEDLFETYMNNAFTNIDSLPEKGDIKFFREVTRPKNWLAKLPLPPFTYLKGKPEEARYGGFVNIALQINFLQDYWSIFGRSEQADRRFVQGYVNLLKAHQKGLEEERKATADRIKGSAFGKALSSLTGAVTGKRFIFGGQREQESKEKGDKDHGDSEL